MAAVYNQVLRPTKGLSVPAKPEWFTGPVRQHWLTGTETGHEVLGVWFPAGARTQIHHHAADQVLHCFEGEIAVGIGTVRRLLQPGELIVLEAGGWHWHGATPLGAAAHFSIKPHADTTWGGAPAAEQAEFDAYADWAAWVAGVTR